MPELMTILAKGAMHLVTPAVQNINDTDWRILEFDQATVERGGITCEVANNSITVASTGVYTVNMGINATFPGTEEIDVIAFVNGTQYSQYSFNLRGTGTNRPTAIFWQSTVNLADGDVIDLRCKNGKGGSFDLELLRMYLCVIKEH